MVQVSTTWHTFFISILKSQVSNIDCRLKIFILKRGSKWWSNSKAFCIFLSKWNLKNVSQDFLQIQRSRSWECFKGWKRREVFHKTFLRDWFLLERFENNFQRDSLFCKLQISLTLSFFSFKSYLQVAEESQDSRYILCHINFLSSHTYLSRNNSHEIDLFIYLFINFVWIWRKS